MAIAILQQFLDKQFIHLDNDGDHEKLKKVIEDLKKKWGKDKKKIIGATMIALDPDVDLKEPLIKEVHTAITSKWTTFVNSTTSTKDTPLTYIRAVILELLQQYASDHVNHAALILYAGRNIIRYYNIDREGAILQDFFYQLSQQVEKEGILHWQGIIDIALPEFTVPTIENKGSNGQGINTDELATILKSASIHSSWGHGGKNPALPQNGHQWGTFFSDTAAAGIAEQFSKALSGYAKQAMVINGILKEYFSGMRPYLEQVAQSMRQGYQVLNLKNHLLWWKASLSSTIMSASYRDMNPLVAACCMAADLAADIPFIYPQSVDHFLAEALRDVLGEHASQPKELSQHLQEMEAQTDIFQRLLPSSFNQEGRCSLSAFIQSFLQKERTLEDLHIMTGIDLQVKVSLKDLCIWFFHDLQARKISTIK